MSKYMAKGAVRSIKNYTKGYSEIQAKVREATSNDPWGPSGTLMDEIGQATYNHQNFLEIMEILDKRLNDHGKNWRHVFKALIVLDYCLHIGSEEVVKYAKKNVYIVKTLKEFQFIDEYGKDQGVNVRQRAKEIANLLEDDERLKSERQNRANMRERIQGSRYDPMSETADRSVPYDQENTPYIDEEGDLQKAIEESKKLEREKTLKANQEDEENLQKAIRLSKEEAEAAEQRKKEQERNNTLPQQQQTDIFGNPIPLEPSLPNYGKPDLLEIYDNNQNLFQNNNQFINNPYTQQQLLQLHLATLAQLQQSQQQTGYPAATFPSNAQRSTSFLDSFTSTPQSTLDSRLQAQLTGDKRLPQLTPTQKKVTERNAALNDLLATGEGQDTFGNVGNLRVPVGSGYANSSNLLATSGRSNSTGTIGNPFVKSGSLSPQSTGTFSSPQLGGSISSQPTGTSDLLSLTSGSAYSSITQPATPFSTTSFTSSNANPSLIDFDLGSQSNRNPFQGQQGFGTMGQPQQSVTGTFNGGLNLQPSPYSSNNNSGLF
ncbi:8853_t:CDS:10 [Paraglomus brasilianum]|uniref:8853_t:CDS:1 n=1 Tax=Paraglomus brasilianum TaxID=144538 RepID=A0A9N9CI44_9GLOM|nr:8853_t:CDS:10 [Paraglomus brasilianum]